MTLAPPYPVNLVGCGKMGAALIRGWIAAGLLKRAEILDPNSIPDSFHNLHNLFHVKQVSSLTFSGSGLLTLAIKPQIMDQVCTEIKNYLPADYPVLSIAAGKTTEYFQQQFGKGQPIIRAMPNTPAAIGQGMTALYATPSVTPDQKQMAETLLAAVGKVIWLEDEKLMDAVTAVSGSGPAYVFYLIEAMAEAGEQAGLNKEHAMLLARQTIIGAAALAAQESEVPASTLRQNVTSPGGTTEAALNVLMDGRFRDVVNEAITAAVKRGQALAK